VFAGRGSEDFKLASGTWVNVSAARTGLLQALAPLASDAAIAGHDRDAITALVFLDAARCRTAAGATQDFPLAQLAAHEGLLQQLAERLSAFNAGAGGSSHRIARIAVLADAPDADAFEITDKGYLNQRAVLQRRASTVHRLYEDASASVLPPATPHREPNP